MLIFIIRRLLQSIPVLFGITIISFLMIHLAPGSPMGQLMDPKVPPKVMEEWRKLFHLDEPLYVQYGLWLKNLVTGQLKSFKDGRPVLTKIKERLPATLLLNIVATLIIFSVAIPLGIFSATHRYSIADHVTTTLAFVGISLPSFWIAYLLILVAVKGFGLPVLGVRTFGLEGLSPSESFFDRIWHLFLPALIASITEIASLSRYMRASMIEVMQQDYIRTARAKGLEEDEVKYRHSLRNALLPIITIFGFLIPGLIGGSVITESVFAWPGIGQLGYQSVLSRDYPTIMTLTTISAILVLIGNLVADVLYAWADPRIRYD